VIILIAQRQGGFMLNKLPNGKPFMRIGEGGEPFQFKKYRSMIRDAHKLRYDKEFIESNKIRDTRKGSPLSKFEKDPRITPFGRFIRATSIDEIPQFYNVLFGQMSLVGPRPHLPEEVDKYKPEQLKVLTIKPGITGMAQVSGRADLDFDDEVTLDIFYIENWTPWIDIAILAKTPIAVLKGIGAS
jgi:lipopolysaccharide/colanic/teichoic acid biosynthesis glycosyltransferase